MHYRPWVFLALFSLAGVSAADDAKPANTTSPEPSTSVELTEEDIPAVENEQPPKTTPLSPCGSSRSDPSAPGGRYNRTKCAAVSGGVYIPPKPDDRPIPERLSTSDIMAVVLANKRAIVECVNSQKKEEPDRTGKLVMRWEVRTNGSTQNVRCRSPEFAETFIASCLTQEIQRWTFPRHKVKGEPIDFPFVF